MSCSRYEELEAGISVNFINNFEFQVYKHCLGHMFASAILSEGVERVISFLNGLNTWHLVLRLDALI